MSSESVRCTHCEKILANKYVLATHIHRMHRSQEEPVEKVKCSSENCTYSTTNRVDLKKHEHRCRHFQNEQKDFLLRAEFEQKIATLQTENNLLRSELEKAQAVIERTAQRPTTTTNNHHSVRITNYLADHATYREQTDPERVMKILLERLPDYIADGQSGLARCLEENVIRKGDEMILCCTDPTRNRFRYLNEKGELVDDMRAHHFAKTVSAPVKTASVQMFQEQLARIEEKKVGVTDPFELHRIDQEIDAYRDSLWNIKEFDDRDTNHQFVGTLSDRLRHVS